MQNGMFRNVFVIGIIVIFIGVSFIPTISGNKELNTTSNNEFIDYIRYDDFEDYYVGEPPKSERGWSTEGVTSNQFIEASVDPLDSSNMVMLIHGSTADYLWCILKQENITPVDYYVIHYKIYTPQLSTSNTIFEWYREENTTLVEVLRKTGQIRWGSDGYCGGYYEFTPTIDPSTTSWIEEEGRVIPDEFRYWHDNSIDALGGYCNTPVNGTSHWQIAPNKNCNQDFYIDDFWITEYNLPPDTPSNPIPPDDATGVGIWSSLSWTCSDPDGDNLTFDIYFGTTYPPPLVSSNQSGTTFDPGVLQFCTTYFWQIVAWDEHGPSTPGPIWNFTTRCNDPPGTPIINGPKSGKPHTDYSYTFVSVDPDGDDIFYQINWGDGTVDDWFGPFNSNEITIRDHGWDERGNYTVMARAKDEFDTISNWSEFTVTMPRDKTINNPFLNFLQSNPNMFPILQRLLQYLGL